MMTGNHSWKGCLEKSRLTFGTANSEVQDRDPSEEWSHSRTRVIQQPALMQIKNNLFRKVEKKVMIGQRKKATIAAS